MQIQVGPPHLTINYGSTFMVTRLDGQIEPDRMLGIFSDDTRFLSRYTCQADGKSWVRLTSTTTAYYAMRIYLQNPKLVTKQGTISAGSLSLVVSRTVVDGIHEDLDLTNHSRERVSFNLELTLRSDFSPLFEVEAGKFVRRGRIETHWDDQQHEFSNSYEYEDFYRCLSYQPRNYSSPPHFANGYINFEIELEPGETWHTCGYYTLKDDKHVRQPIDCCYKEALEQGVNECQRLWLDEATKLSSSNNDVTRLYRQSVQDLGALRLYDYDFAPDVWLPAAGVPKFVALFGRDSLITSLQNAIVHPGFAEGALKKLAQLQGTKVNDWRDEEPGKILHELRLGELAHFNKIPHSPYYGTADATTLYLITLHETWKWLGRDSLLREYRDTALRCLDWIDEYGDLDRDGFQEFKSCSEEGIENQGWKDSGESIVYSDGSQVEAPEALCQLQGYVFDAWLRMAEVFEALGESDRSRELRAKAAKLRTQFEERFWCDDIGFYGLTLDAGKKLVTTITSNPGHCLWSGIVSPEHAQRVVKRLLKPDMWSGWGIRTLSTQNPAYNPFSYHLGSVWPVDNSIIALGFKRYGFAEEVAQVAEGIFEAATHFASYRLPELYAGNSRETGSFPVPYLDANVPQAWAAASVFQLLQAMLGLHADAPKGCLYVDPHLPEWLPDLTLCDVEIKDAVVDLRFWREGDSTCWDASVRDGNVEVQEKSWQPWAVKEPTAAL